MSRDQAPLTAPPPVASRPVRFAELRVPAADLGVRIALDDDANPETAEAFWRVLPFESVIGHQVIAGGGLWVITRLVYTGARRSVRRTPGSVYFYPLIQSLNLTYDDVRETAHVNEFGRVPEEDLPVLARIGEYVWNSTVAAADRRPVRVLVGRLAEEAA